MVKPGWQSKIVFFSLAASILTSWSVMAAGLTVRDISFKDEDTVQVQFDAPANARNIDVEFVRDIIQFTVKGATIYPAKIIHTDSSHRVGFSKLFAYQYSPSLVRIRLTVEGDASTYRKKFQWASSGKSLQITVPALKEKSGLSEGKERSLLAKVLGSSDAEPVKEEKTAPASAPVETKPAGALGKKSKNAAQEATVTTENLGGAKSGPSVFRSFLAMFLVVGGLGIVLVYVKQRKGSAQAKRVGDSWLDGILGTGKGKRPLIEIVSTHPLGAKQSITVVRIRDQQFVLGVTQDSVQLITQLDSDELNAEVLDDPKVADSIGKMFGNKPTAPKESFQSLLKGSTGANAVVARSAYQAQTPQAPVVQNAVTTPPAVNQGAAPGFSTRDRIRQHLQGVRS